MLTLRPRQSNMAAAGLWAGADKVYGQLPKRHTQLLSVPADRLCLRMAFGASYSSNVEIGMELGTY